VIADENDFPDVVHGDGYSTAHLDALGDGYGFRRVRRGLGIEAFGANAIVLPPRYEAGAHQHEQQEELYFVHSGQVEMEFGDGSVITLEPGSLVRVDADTVRRLRNFGYEDAVVLAIGGKGGYVGRDGKLPEGEVRAGGPIDG
jgi:mannose-6-phosphate isomerase-like protein (cupin superfamily)